jgi:hypothetical protein
MPKWEYRVLTLIGTDYSREYTVILEMFGEPAFYQWTYEEKLLGGLGQQGWELVASLVERSNEGTKYIFKRPVSD